MHETSINNLMFNTVVSEKVLATSAMFRMQALFGSLEKNVVNSLARFNGLFPFFF